MTVDETTISRGLAELIDAIMRTAWATTVYGPRLTEGDRFAARKAWEERGHGLRAWSAWPPPSWLHGPIGGTPEEQRDGIVWREVAVMGRPS